MLRVGRKHGNDDRVGTFPHHADHFAACRYCKDQRLGRGIVDRIDDVRQVDGGDGQTLGLESSGEETSQGGVGLGNQYRRC